MLGYFDFSDVLNVLYNALYSIFEVKMTLQITNNDIHCTEQNAVYNGDLPQPLLPGHCIAVTGTPVKHCDRFSVNFLCGNYAEANIALHFNPRLKENYVVRNSRRNEKWENEDTTSHLRLNLPRNVQFQLLFFISYNEFLISINHDHFCAFKYRMPINEVSSLNIEGDVIIENVEVKEYMYFPDNNEMYKNVPFTNIYDGKTELQNPFIGFLHKGFKSGWQLEIYGKVKILPSEFYINLQDGCFIFPHPSIPLHINPRFGNIEHKDALIFNSWQDGVWGTEERSSGFLFSPSKSFHLVIQLDLDRNIFIIWVNGQIEREFQIRNLYDVNCINTVKIQGDLAIYAVFLRKNFTNMFENHY